MMQDHIRNSRDSKRKPHSLSIFPKAVVLSPFRSFEFSFDENQILYLEYFEYIIVRLIFAPKYNGNPPISHHVQQDIDNGDGDARVFDKDFFFEIFSKRK